jgi:nucleotide-binding universal stress UspA family protein
MAGVPAVDIRAHRARAHQEALAKLAALDMGTKLRHRPAIVAREDPVRLILETEKSHKADLIVIGRRGQSKVEEFVLGSVARRVLGHAKCDVLVATGRSTST